MARVARICISVEEPLLDEFESYLTDNGYPNRSEAMKGLMRQALVEKEWVKGLDVAGAISIVYDAQRRGVLDKLLSIQHSFADIISCAQCVHLEQQHCLEVDVVRGSAQRIEDLMVKLRSIKGVKHAELMRVTTGRGID